MSRKITLSKRAISGLRKITIYIADSFGEDRAHRYEVEVEEFFRLIEQLPAAFPRYPHPTRPYVEKAVFEELTVVYYSFDNKEFFVLDVRDARRKEL